jgi:hypothetical protein
VADLTKDANPFFQISVGRLWFRLGQHGGFEKEYARAAASGSEYYLLWNKGIDVVYVVGFDKDGRVTMKAVGGT